MEVTCRALHSRLLFHTVRQGVAVNPDRLRRIRSSRPGTRTLAGRRCIASNPDPGVIEAREGIVMPASA